MHLTLDDLSSFNSQSHQTSKPWYETGSNVLSKFYKITVFKGKESDCWF